MAALKSDPVEDKPNLMITGASGMLGDALCRLARRQWTVFGIYKNHPLQIEGVRRVRADLNNLANVSHLVAKIQPRAVIHAAAISQVMDCEANPQSTETINVRLPARLADLCAEGDIDYLFTSTDLVFDGTSAPYGERDGVNPLCAYGHQKAAAEEEILYRYPNALVCRLPLMFGLSPHAMRHFTAQMLRAIKSGQPLALLVDEFRTPVDNTSAARGILGLLGKSRGVLHLGGRSRVSRYELGLLMADCMNIKPEMLNPTTIAALDIGVARSPDCSLSSAMAYRLGYAPAPLSRSLERIAERFNKISNS